MDKGLDEIISDKRRNAPRNNRRGGDGRRDRREGPRDGVRKSYRDEPRSIDSEWVHDRFEDDDRRRAPAPRRRREDREEPQAETRGTKIKVDNLHYDLTEEDLGELFRRIGNVIRLQLRFDRAGRSEGVAFVTYEHKDDAEEAVKQFDGANANGQPIRLALVPSRNPFDTAVMPGRPLSERVSAPGGRYTEDDAKRRGVDRYIPDGREGGREGGRDRSKSPRGPRRRGGRRPGARREGGDSGREGRDGGRGGRGNPRSKKTQDELDAEMDDYFTKNDGAGANGAAATTEGTAPAPGPSDMDMIE
ncbi:RNA binding domain protein [Cordyceps fumosorosea ARSEF 2679]|uniref:RNA binding domain protein n=1 Tax=Cordyceps fumosorosea (strain ARSEF 2679) TaxID=1081104 RepID=A0A168DXG3_CORFA|nr:RNA binding domain protein [Cordyceps fumosorosea ARSEF 2679]OAA73123.1 RNA binding domain protein [Cordyceps fumosorosea ARSEF 2679]